MPFVTCALFLGDDDRGFVCRYGPGPAQALFKWTPKHGASCRCACRRVPMAAPAAATTSSSCADLRLMFEGRLIGASRDLHTAPACYTDEHRRVLGRVSEQAAAVINNSTATSRHARVANRRVDGRCQTAVPSSASGGRPAARGEGALSASLVVLDLDRLKEINDTTAMRPATVHSRRWQRAAVNRTRDG